MFVYPFELVLKTCGTTTLLACLDRLLEIGRGLGLTAVDYVFYSRKSFMFPDRQLYPHPDWNAEVDWLDRYFGFLFIICCLTEFCLSFLTYV